MDVRCALRVGLFVLGLVWRWAHARHPHLGLVLADDFPNPQDGGGGIIDFVSSLLLGLIQFVWDQLVNVANYLYSILKQVAQAFVDLAKKVAEGFVQIGKWLGKVVDVLKRFWSNVLKPLLRRIADAIAALQRFLRRIFGPVLKVLDAIRQHIRDIYSRFVRPILDVIDAFRLFLRGLSALGVDWAKELDKKLGELEDAINAPFLEIYKILNQIASVIDRILTLDGILTRLLWLQSLAGYRRPTFNYLWNSQSTPVDDDHLKNQRKENAAPEPDKVTDDLRSVLETESGDLQTRVSELETQMKIWLAAI